MEIIRRASKETVAMIPIDLADMGRSSAAPLHNRGKPIEGTSLVLDVTIAIRSQFAASN
jgi:hypothetical protein